MHRFVAALVLVAAILGGGRAHACINAVMAEDETVATLKRADEALDVGDYAMARDLARDVRNATARDAFSKDSPSSRYHDRAVRIVALSYTRDPTASRGDRHAAVQTFEMWIAMIRGTIHRDVDPPMLADLGEALEGDGRDMEALEQLVPLADKDLIGSAYAYAALARAAGRNGDRAHEAMASTRCATMAATPNVCRGIPPRPPLLRGGPLPYIVPVAVFAFAASFRRKPWRKYRRRAFDAVLGAGLLVALVVAHTMWRVPWPLGFALFFTGFVALVQRSSFLLAVRSEKIPEMRLRAQRPNDEAPLTRFFGGPDPPLVLERVTEPTYRDAGGAPILRIAGRPRWVTLVLVALLVFGGIGGGMLALMRGTTRSSAIPAARDMN